MHLQAARLQFCGAFIEVEPSGFFTALFTLFPRHNFIQRDERQYQALLECDFADDFVIVHDGSPFMMD